MSFLVLLQAVVVLAKVQFAGGPDSSLVDFVADRCGRDIAMLSDPERRWPAIELMGKNADEFDIQLKNYLKGSHLPSVGMAAADRTYPRVVFFTQSRGMQARIFSKSKIKSSYKSAKFEVRTTGPVTLSAALGIGLKQNVEWHWFFEDIYLYVRALDITEDDYIRLLAKTIGAKIVHRSSKVYLDMDYDGLRKRSIDCLKRLANFQPIRGGKRADYLFTAETMALASNAQLARVYQEQIQEREIELQLKSKLLNQLAYEKLKNRFPIDRDSIRRTQADIIMWDHLKDKLDLSRPPNVILENTGQARAVFYGKSEVEPIRLVI